MTVTAHLYDEFFANLAAAKINLSSDTVKCALVSSSYTPNQASDEYWSTPQADEITGTGYTAGGVALTSTSWTDTSHVWTYTAANVSWTSSTITAAYAVLYDTTAGSGASTYPLVGYVNFGGNVSDTAGTFQITWNASGIFTVTIS